MVYGVAVDLLVTPISQARPGRAFPLHLALSRALPGGTDAFVTKLNTDGLALIYSTYLGGSGREYGHGIAVNSSGNAYVTGATDSANFPATPGAFETVYHGKTPCSVYSDKCAAFLSKLNANGSALVYSTYLGGSGGSAIAVDAAGNAYVTGSTSSDNFPTTPGALRTTVTQTNLCSCCGNQPCTWAFVSKLNPAGSSLVYSTYLGDNEGSFFDSGSGIAIDTSGNAYVAGETGSGRFPTTPGAFKASWRSFGGCGDSADVQCSTSFVSKLNSAGSGLLYSTFLSGNGRESGWAGGIAVDAFRNAYVSGRSATFDGNFDFPTTPGAIPFDMSCGTAVKQGYLMGCYEGFVTKLNGSGSALLYSTYLGASGLGASGFSSVAATGVALDPSGGAYVTGSADSGFVTTAGALQTNSGGNSDAFVIKLKIPAVALTPMSLTFAAQAVGTSAQPSP